MAFAGVGVGELRKVCGMKRDEICLRAVCLEHHWKMTSKNKYRLRKIYIINNQIDSTRGGIIIVHWGPCHNKAHGLRRPRCMEFFELQVGFFEFVFVGHWFHNTGIRYGRDFQAAGCRKLEVHSEALRKQHCIKGIQHLKDIPKNYGPHSSWWGKSSKWPKRPRPNVLCWKSEDIFGLFFSLRFSTQKCLLSFWLSKASPCLGP